MTVDSSKPTGRRAHLLVDVAILVGLAAMGFRAGRLGVGYDTLWSARETVSAQPFLVLSLHLFGTLALAAVAVRRSVSGMTFGAAFVIYSTVALAVSEVDRIAGAPLWTSSALSFAGLMVAWTRRDHAPSRPETVRATALVALGALLGFVVSW